MVWVSCHPASQPGFPPGPLLNPALAGVGRGCLVVVASWHTAGMHTADEAHRFISSSPLSPSPGDGAKEPGQPCCGGQRVLRDQGPLCSSAPGSGCGYQRLGHPQTQPGGDLEVSISAGVAGNAWQGWGHLTQCGKRWPALSSLPSPNWAALWEPRAGLDGVLVSCSLQSRVEHTPLTSLLSSPAPSTRTTSPQQRAASTRPPR